jgi:hypothetical protein
MLNAKTVLGDSAGFSVIPHERILEMHKQKALEVAKAGVNSARAATVTWPKLLIWTQEAWMTFDKAWWNCVNAAVHNGVYQNMISLIDLDIQEDVQIDLNIDPDHSFDTAEIDFIRKAHAHFGPKNKEQALDILKQVQCTVYSRSKLAPDAFLKILSNYNTTFMRALDLQIAPSVSNWPAVGKPKARPLTLKTIRKSFKDGFAGSKSSSAACMHCYTVVDMNHDMPHKELYTELRVHFQDDAEYLKRSTLKGGSTDDKTQGTRGATSDGGSGGRAYGGSGGRANGGSVRNERSGQRSRDRFGNRQNKTDDKSKPSFKVVQGKDRCPHCGDYTNHYGHGSKMCAKKGTKHDKGANYKWKDSDVEPKVAISDAEFQQLRKDKAEIFKQNAINRTEYRQP